MGKLVLNSLKLTYADQKVRLKFVAHIIGQKYVCNCVKENCSLIPWKKLKNLKKSTCSFLLRVSLLPRCKLIPQISMS